jgi:hypothetical protein
MKRYTGTLIWPSALEQYHGVTGLPLHAQSGVYSFRFCFSTDDVAWAAFQDLQGLKNCLNKLKIKAVEVRGKQER